VVKLSELTPADMEDIVGLVGFGDTRKEVARAYGIRPSLVSAIVLRREYQDLQRQEDIDQFSIAVTGSRSLGIL
jgi:hypothetical protein